MKKAIKIIIPVIVLALLGWLAYYVYGGSVGQVISNIPDPVTDVVIPVRPDIILDNPYQDVNWQAYGQHKASLHVHTGNSDGWFSPGKVIDEYHDRGYTILALVDHNNVTWPWQDFGHEPDELGMLAIQASEISDTHHIGSYFNDFNIDGRKYRPYFFATGDKTELDEHAVIQAIGENDGLAVIFHPGRYDYPPEWYLDFYETYDHVVGLEVINQGNRYPDDRIMWDEILTELMPDRPVWGFSNDDMHVLRHLGHCFNMFLLPELTEEEFRSAMMAGQFYFSLGEEAPVINSITVDNEAGLVSINAADYNEIIWISEGRVISAGNTLDFTDTPNVGSYVRAKIFGDGGTTYSNPFGVRTLDLETEEE